MNSFACFVKHCAASRSQEEESQSAKEWMVVRAVSHWMCDELLALLHENHIVGCL